MGKTARHRHEWGARSSVSGVLVVYECECGGVVRVWPSSVGVTVDVVSEGRRAFRLLDAKMLGIRALPLLAALRLARPA